MYYRETFKDLLKTTTKGFVIGAFISTLLTVVFFKETNVGLFIQDVIGCDIIIGSIASIIICSKSGMQGILGGAASHLWSGIKEIFFGGIFEGGAVFMIFGIIKLIIGLFIMVPVAIFMASSYFFNLIYFGIMSILEKKNMLENKSGLCNLLDKLSPVLAGVVTLVWCVMIIKAM